MDFISCRLVVYEVGIKLYRYRYPYLIKVICTLCVGITLSS